MSLSEQIRSALLHSCFPTGQWTGRPLATHHVTIYADTHRVQGVSCSCFWPDLLSKHSLNVFSCEGCIIFFLHWGVRPSYPHVCKSLFSFCPCWTAMSDMSVVGALVAAASGAQSNCNFQNYWFKALICIHLSVCPPDCLYNDYSVTQITFYV